MSTYTEELKVPKDIEIKLYRLTPPILDTINIPLNGLYNPIDNIESVNYSLNNKLKNFDISSNKCVNIENLLGFNTTFGKVFTNEYLEVIICLLNISDHEVIVKDLKVTVKNEDKNNKKKAIEEPIETILSNNSVSILPNKGYPIKIKKHLKYVSKYIIDINFHTRSQSYDQFYFKTKQRTIVKDKGEFYCVTGGVVEFYNNKKFFVEVNNPFKISEIFHISEINTCFIEINIANISGYPLTIYDLFLTPKNKREEKIQIFKSFDKIKNISNDSKFLMIQNEEQINLLFKLDNPDLFYDEEKFYLNVFWMKDFDFVPKVFVYKFDNNLSTYNKYYKMTVIEKPQDDILVNQNFKIVINLKTKNLDNKYIISLNQEPIKDNDKTNDREIEIIDIIEKKMELNSKTPSNNFILICKSDVLGNVYLPKLKFSLYEGDKNNPIENTYKALLSFNCISQIKGKINE